MKKTVCFIFALIALFSLPFTSFASSADSSTEKYIALHVDISKALVNGSVVDLTDGGESYSPFASGGRTFVPLRFVAEQMGGTVEWNNSAKQAVISIGSNKVTFTYGLKKYKVNSKEFTMDVAPMGVNGHTYIPVRFMCESIGKVVSYDNASGYIKIGDKNMTPDELAFIISNLGQYVESHYNENMASTTPIIFSDGSIYYNNSSSIRKINPDGKETTILTNSFTFYGYCVKVGNYIYHANSQQGSLNRFNILTGKDEIMQKVDYIGGVFMYGGKLFAVNKWAYAGFSTLYSYDQNKNKLTKIFDKKVEGPVIKGNTIYFIKRREGDYQGDLCKLSINGKDYTQLTNDRRITSICFDDTSVYAIEHEGIVSMDFDGKNIQQVIPSIDVEKGCIYHNISVRNNYLYYGIENVAWSNDKYIGYEQKQTMYRYNLRTGETEDLKEMNGIFHNYFSTDFHVVGDYIYGRCRKTDKIDYTDMYVFDMDGKLLNHVPLQ